MILFTNAGDSNSSGVSISDRICSSKVNTTLIQDNIKTTLNTRSINNTSIGSLSYSLTVSNNTSNTTCRKIDFQFLIGSIPCKNINCLVRTANINSGGGARNKSTDNSIYSQNDGILKYFTTSARNSSQCFICLLYTSPSPRDVEESRMPSSA